jgi:hypothetical protein
VSNCDYFFLLLREEDAVVYPVLALKESPGSIGTFPVCLVFRDAYRRDNHCPGRPLVIAWM